MMNENLENSLFGDMATLEKTLSSDHSGDRALAMLAHFKTVSEICLNMLPETSDMQERSMIQKLNSGFESSRRIVRHVWETIHGTMLHE